MTPNQIYEDSKIYDGIPASSADIIKVFADIERKIKVHRSMIKLQVDNTQYTYTIFEPAMVVKLNGTVVVVRATKMDMASIYVFDPKTDGFLCCVKETIPVYGDKKSMDQSDEKRIKGFSQKRKSIKRYIEGEHLQSQEVEANDEFTLDLNIIPND